MITAREKIKLISQDSIQEYNCKEDFILYKEKSIPYRNLNENKFYSNNTDLNFFIFFFLLILFLILIIKNR